MNPKRKTQRKNQKQVIIKVLLNPITGSFVAILAVLAGAIISVFADQIRQSFPFYIAPEIFNPKQYGSISGWAFAFWSLFILFFLLSAIRQYYQDNALDQKNDKLISALSTLPNASFPIAYAEEYDKTEKMVNRLAELNKASGDGSQLISSDLVLFEETIRTILSAYVNLCLLWDYPDPDIHPDLIYRANIMEYYESTSVPAYISGAFEKYTRFFVDKNPESILRSIDGILVIENNTLSTIATKDNAEPDPDIKPLILSVTKTESKAKRHQNIPGAPMAIISNKVQWILDPSVICEQCKNNEQIDPETLKKIVNYYGKNERAKSIISLPLEFRESTVPPSKGKAVLNLYRNKERILKSDLSSAQFAAYLEPFNYLLCNALSEYSTIRASIPRETCKG